MWTHVDRGRGVINVIFVDVINGWPLSCLTVCQSDSLHDLDPLPTDVVLIKGL